MTNARRLIASFVAVGTCVIGAQAQEGAWNPFDTSSTGAIMCRRLPDSAADSADVVLHFLDHGASFKDRERRVGFDTSGRPLYMTLSTTELRKGGNERLHAFIVRFHPFEKGVGESDEPNSTLRDLTSSELQLARKLAVHSWERGCR